MLSRAAEAIYWMNRYLERAENVARFIEVTVNLILDTPDAVAETHWQALVSTTGDQDLFEKSYGEANHTNVIQFLTLDPSYQNSIVSCLAAARENARSVREVISREMWEALNLYYRYVKNIDLDIDDVEQVSNFYETVKRRNQMLNGVTDGTMSHGEAWQFGQLGRMIERADKTSRILDVKYFILLPGVADVGSAMDLVQWSALLQSASASQMFRQRYHTTTPAHVAEFLVLDDFFPRSVRYCTHAAQRALDAIVAGHGMHEQRKSQRSLGRLAAQLRFDTVEDLLKQGMHEYLDAIQLVLNQASSDISADFFTISAS